MSVTTNATSTSTANNQQQQQQQPNIFRMFYTHKRTMILLEDGWVNAKGERVSGVKVKRVEKVSTTANYTDKKTGKITTKFLNCVHVIYISASGKRCSQFISCRAYLARATQKRKEESEKYKAYQNFSDATQWSVYPVANQNKVSVESKPQTEDAPKPKTVITVREGVFCDCEDFSNQEHYLKQHPYLWEKVIKGYLICKHSLCTLSQLGFGSLRDYMKAWKPNGRLSKLSAVMNRTTSSSY